MEITNTRYLLGCNGASSKYNREHLMEEETEIREGRAKTHKTQRLNDFKVKTNKKLKYE